MSRGLRDETLRKGWCPGALQPMAAADGLIVRLRLTCGILPAATALALADLAEAHGNGRLDLTTRANLQIRGVRLDSWPALLDALRELGLVDADAGAEAVRNVIASPLAGLHDGPDIPPVVAALEARLAGTPTLHALPGKFGFLVDDGSAPSLADVAADVRFDWTGDRFAIGLGGTRGGALACGACGAEELVDRAETVARGALDLFARRPEARRLRDLFVEGADFLLPLAGEGDPAKRGRTRAVPEGARTTSSITPSPLIRPDFVGPPSPASGRRTALSLAAPYGRLDAYQLRLAADIAAWGRGDLRLTPWRSLLVPGVDGPAARERARRADFIVDADDPRHAVAACVGAPECARATTTTRADADAFADVAVSLGPGTTLHVSGCAKGCAHAGIARATLVGRDGRYDLVLDGRASDPAALRGLDRAAARAALAALPRA